MRKFMLGFSFLFANMQKQNFFSFIPQKAYKKGLEDKTGWWADRILNKKAKSSIKKPEPVLGPQGDILTESKKIFT